MKPFRLLMLCILTGFASVAQTGWKDLFPTFRYTSSPSSSRVYAINSFNQLYASSDGGATWSVKPVTTNTNVVCIGFHFPSNDIGYFTGKTPSSGGMVMKTTDGGNTFQDISPVCNKILYNAYFLDDNNGWVVGEDTAFKTSNGGASWTGVGGFRYTTLTNIHFSDPVHGVAFGNTQYTDSANTFITNDGGASWHGYKGPSKFWNYTVVSGCYRLSGTRAFVYGGNKVCYKTVNAGATWSKVNLNGDMSNSPVRRMKFYDNGYGIMLSNERKYVTNDSGSTWKEFYTSFDGSAGIMDYALLDSIHYVAAANDNALLYSSDKGMSYTALQGAPFGMAADPFDQFNYIAGGTGFSKLWFLNDSVGYAAVKAYHPWLYKTTNSGKQWKKVPGSVVSGLEIRGLEFVSDKDGFLMNNDGNFYKTTDTGTTWQSMANVATGFTASAFDFLTPAIAYAGGNAGKVYKTTDGGTTWILVNTGMSTDIYAIRFLNASNGYIGASSGKVYITSDGGTTWQPFTMGSSPVTYIYPKGVNEVYFSASYSGETWLYDGTGLTKKTGWPEAVFDDQAGERFGLKFDGLYQYNNVANNWAKVYGNCCNMWFGDVFTTPNKVYFGQMSGNLAVLHDDVVAGIKEYRNQEKGSVIVYPNPAGSTLTLKLDQAIKACKVYDINGRSALLSVQDHTIVVEDLKPGIYFMEVDTGKQLLHSKFMKE